MEIAINMKIVAARWLVLETDSLRENEFSLSGGRYIDLYLIIRYLFGYLFRDYIKKSTWKGIKNVIGSCK